MSILEESTHRRAPLSADRQALLETWLRRQSQGKPQEQTIPRRPAEVEKAPPLSFAQQRLWFINRLDPSNVAYNVPTALRLRGFLKVAAVEEAIQRLVERHETLRTTYAVVSGAPVQVIAPVSPSMRLPLPLIDLSAYPEAEREERAREIMEREVRRPFDLERGPLLYTSLLRLDPQEHILLVSTHHTISDAWALDIFTREWMALYEACASGKPSPLPELPIQYADFAAWQQTWLQGEALNWQLEYWKRHLAGAAMVLELPTDHPRPPLQSFRGTSLLFKLPQELAQRLKTFCVRAQCTLFQALFAAFQTLLYRYSGQADFLVGTPIANRTRPETEGLIGVFVNTLALRTSLPGNPTFRELVQRVREETLEAYAHQDAPFEKLVEALQVPRDLSRNPLFQVMFVFQNNQVFTQQFGDLSLRVLRLDNVAVQFDLTLSMSDTDEGILGALEYNTDLFEKATMERLVGHLQTLLESALSNPDQRVDALPLLTPAEHRQLLVDWNATAVDLPLQRTFFELFSEQAALTPEAAAVCYGEQVLTYGELEARARQAASLLRSLGVEREALVGIYMERSPEMVVAMLGTFLAGGAYVPLDPAYPPERLSLILEDARPAVIVTQRRFRSFLPEQAACIVVLEPDRRALEGQPGDHEGLPYISPFGTGNVGVGQPRSGDDEGAPTLDPEQLAYVIYTSGSTGRPKGAMLNHRGMLNHLYAKIRDLRLCAEDAVAQTASHCFDVSIWQFFSALLVGGTVHIFPDEVTHNPERLLEELATASITIVELVPSLLRAMLDGAPQRVSNLVRLRWMVATGETLPIDLCRRWFEAAPAIPLVNAYGPTECSDDVTHMLIERSTPLSGASAPIGHAIANTRIYLLDDHLQPVPVGIPGQLFVGGVGVGRGYLHNPGRTAAVFLPDPFSSEMGACMYQTGDLVRYLPGGTIEFLGRIDSQVKLRGYRIELGEIEAALLAQPQVREAVVILLEDAPGQKRLVAYLVAQPESSLSTAGIRSSLEQHLPEYMIPSAFVVLEGLPLTPNGKIDRRALPEPEDEQRPELAVTYIPPASQIERTIATIWQEVLHIDRVGLHDNFFDLGGHSLLMVQVHSKLQEALRTTSLSMLELFRYPSVSTLAEYLNQSQQAKPEQLSSPLFSTAQQRAQNRKEAMQRLRGQRSRQ